MKVELEAEGLEVWYGSRRALYVERLRLESGEPVCVLGPNGSGKSSLLKALARIAGRHKRLELRVDGAAVDGGMWHRYVSYSGVEAVKTGIKLKVIDLLLISRIPARRGFFYSAEDYDAVERVGRELELEGLMDRHLDELSSGELQRAIVASALAREPAVALLDEPDAHVDLEHKVKLARLLERVSRERLVVLATHDPIFATSCCRRAVLLKGGSVAADVRTANAERLAAALEEVFGVKIELLGPRDSPLAVPLLSGPG